jgi:hypothetical protein
VFTGNNKTFDGDFDYYAQIYEAYRISVLHFHQIPLWNPWMSGGVPLFANPQFGLFSIQAILVLPVGAIYGLKLAYVIYALAGFAGMYVLCRQVLHATATRSVLLGYIWLFNGFFAGHYISHFTFTSFFLLPWLLYFIARRDMRYSWLGFGLLEAYIILSSIHYAFLTTAFIAALYLAMSLVILHPNKKKFFEKFSISHDGIIFALKAAGVVIVFAGYRFITTFLFVKTNPKIPALLHDTPNSIPLLGKALFLPIETKLPVPAGLQWGWGEYSMYLGLGTGLAFIICLVLLVRYSLTRRGSSPISSPRFLVFTAIIALVTFCFAMGDYSPHSPYQILRQLPGFSETRVAARWLFFPMFSVLVFLATWKRNRLLIDGLLLLAAIELFISYGPISHRLVPVYTPPVQFSNTFTQYDNGRKHLVKDNNPLRFYDYSTRSNVGQVYSDDSIIDTLDGVYNTSRCGVNKSPSCSLVITHNATVTYWSPNKIIVMRTSPGDIELNMNPERGWRVNNTYPFVGLKNLDPIQRFILPGNNATYTIEYAPKLSPGWTSWKLSR